MAEEQLNTLKNTKTYIVQKSRLRLVINYIVISTFYIGLNVWFIVSFGLGPKLLITTSLILALVIIRDFRLKIIIDGEKLHYKKLFKKKSYPIHEIAYMVRIATIAYNGGGRYYSYHIRDQEFNDIFIFPEELLGKNDLEGFCETLQDINPSIHFNLTNRGTLG